MQRAQQISKKTQRRDGYLPHDGPAPRVTKVEKEPELPLFAEKGQDEPRAQQ